MDGRFAAEHSGAELELKGSRPGLGILSPFFNGLLAQIP